MIFNQSFFANLKTGVNLTREVDMFNLNENSSETREEAVLYASKENSTMDGNGLWNLHPNVIPFDLLYLLFILSRSITVVFSLTGLLFNSLIFEATRKINSKALKSKTFIQNAIISDAGMAAGSILVLIGYMVQGFGTSKSVYQSVTNIARHVNAGTLYAQAFASVLLAGDRMYAVVRPMTYHTAGYSTFAKILLLAISWLSAIGIMSVGLIIPFTEDSLADKPLDIKLDYGFRLFSNSAKPAVAIGINSSIFILYIAIFIIFILQRRMNRAVEGSTSERAGTTLSLTLTYFFIHTSSLFLYLPGPIMKLIRDNKLLPTTITGRAGSVINQILVILYVCNSIINPIILGSRVRLIRERLYKIVTPEKSGDPQRSQSGTTNISEYRASSFKK